MKAVLRIAAFAAITLLLTWLWGEGGRDGVGNDGQALRNDAHPYLRWE